MYMPREEPKGCQYISPEIYVKRLAGDPSNIRRLTTVQCLPFTGRDVGLSVEAIVLYIASCIIRSTQQSQITFFSASHDASPLMQFCVFCVLWPALSHGCSACFLRCGLLFHGCEHSKAHPCQLPRLPACLPASTKLASSRTTSPRTTRRRRPILTNIRRSVPHCHNRP